MIEDTPTGKENEIERNLGTQPLDGLMRELGLTNHMISSAAEGLTHKAVQRARTGRRLTPRTQTRVIAAVKKLLATRGQEEILVSLETLFTYKA